LQGEIADCYEPLKSKATVTGRFPRWLRTEVSTGYAALVRSFGNAGDDTRDLGTDDNLQRPVPVVLLYWFDI
jgi:hypothetical protein